MCAHDYYNEKANRLFIYKCNLKHITIICICQNVYLVLMHNKEMKILINDVNINGYNIYIICLFWTMKK